MAPELTVEIIRQFAGGPRIEATFRLALDRPRVLVLFGPSGSGKTTVLRCIAGLEQPEAGRIRAGDELWHDAAAKRSLSPQQRRIGYLPQDYAVFPHLTVLGNIEYGLHGLPPPQRRERARAVLEQFGLAELAGRSARQLSGGQLQRVALARAIAPHPRLLLLDEPLSALDAAARAHLRTELRRLLVAAGVPAILVTHDRTEAIALGDSLAVMVAGKLRQAGPVEEVFQQPVDKEVAEAVGVETVCPGRIIGQQDDLLLVEAGGRQLRAAVPGTEAGAPQGDVYVCIRAEDVILERRLSTAATSARNHLHGIIRSLAREGALVRVQMDCGLPLAALVTRQSSEELQLRDGEAVTAVVKATSVHLIPHGG